MDEQLLEMLKSMGMVQMLTPEQHEERLKNEKIVSEKFLEWVKATPELEGMACVFGCSHDGDSVAALVGGQQHGSVVFDKIMMRLIYNIESSRQNEYSTERFTKEIDRGREHVADE